MGTKQSKIEGTYLSDSPNIQQIKLNPLGPDADNIDCVGRPPTYFNEADPRSPSGCRTPLNFAAMNSKKQKNLASFQEQTPVASNENAFGVLRRRFLKSFAYNINDPRSPSSEINRTPLVYDANDRTFSMDDTFADLFIESRAMPEEFSEKVTTSKNENEEKLLQLDAKREEDEKIESDLEISCAPYENEETLPCPVILQQTPIIEQQEMDPRSPTYGVKRTPILFDDNDDPNDENIIEEILATLSINKSDESSFLSLNTSTGPEVIKVEELKPTNKHLERVRLGKQKPHRTGRSRRQRIYQDREDQENSPKLKKNNAKNIEQKRTPLSCVKNRSMIRSRSVEMSEKAIKARLSLSSFDDNLNPVQNSKVMNLHILQDHVEAMDL